MLDIAGIFDQAKFTGVLCNGIFGFGVDGPQAQSDAITAIAHVLAPGGWLLIGWNTDRGPDPMERPEIAHWFRRDQVGIIPSRQRVAGTTHVYDLLRRLPE
ncbi:hypothetical protein [Phenylobacterium conjunctum]|uniref:Methyltransferase domain-containing protein n=1 Tax=Phenylobacterium conjunctum TaxID=1298959 RepID=A0ABW3T7C0_9CAUL